MRISRQASRRAVAVLLLGSLAIAAPAVAALNTKPENGKTYKGLIRQSATATYPISFKVSATGKTVTNFVLSHGSPRYSSGCYTVNFLSNRVKAPISSQGAFTAKVPIEDPYKFIFGYVTITGKFSRAGHESGAATSKYKNDASCDGMSPYSTKAH